VISLIFIFINHIAKNKSKGVILPIYIFLYLFLGAVASINSQLLTGNIYSYIIILLGTAMIFPIQPKIYGIISLSIHIFFLAGLFLIENHIGSFLVMFINSTGTAVSSFTIALTFYFFQRNDYLNKLTLKRNVDSFRTLFNMNPTPLILTNLHSDKILLINQHAVHYFHLEGLPTSQMDTRFLFKYQEERQLILKGLVEKQQIKNFITELQITPEIKKWSILNFECVDYFDDMCVLISVTDITDIKEKENELLKHASIDMLTGVLNRRSGVEWLRKQIDMGVNGQEFVVCYIDINHLKIVNDRYGHSTGDDLIKTCCETITLRIDGEDQLFRLGGDEFIIIFFEKNLEEVQQVWNNIVNEFKNINDSQQKPYQLSASYGLYHYKPGTAITVEEILEFADHEMYKHKFQSKNSRLVTPSI
jgi:diguanylate cyclase (GGDEF)-like protein